MDTQVMPQMLFTDAAAALAQNSAAPASA